MPNRFKVGDRVRIMRPSAHIPGLTSHWYSLERHKDQVGTITDTGLARAARNGNRFGDWGNWYPYLIEFNPGGAPVNVVDDQLDPVASARDQQPGDHFYRCVGPAHSFDFYAPPDCTLSELCGIAFGKDRGEARITTVSSVVRVMKDGHEFTLLRKE